ncbi:DUF4224 domain-containing protein [Burkholderia cenocepacia]|uniref:DUF4224 domain-containing protein n=1 Tax=Burkholderia cenocepacia TaxID=95486 RepID=UPI002238EF44|nr:DUF4224 domain-containing protein [Burkholderia cenocepacia]MCW5118614.1 DUF4224 domain-containing protein [Burkholderia cenocepacia]MCW5130925.1 DUF4224 domain-containing protein [Burkholderia cenocepacia]MCW5174043.1 DUF4224 domain-containing protein [Burkholderia cenocepacia]
MSTYLTARELADLIGCKPNQRATMARWLDRNGWRYAIDINGLPKVARAFHDQKLGTAAEEPATDSRFATEPDFDALKAHIKRNLSKPK